MSPCATSSRSPISSRRARRPVRPRRRDEIGAVPREAARRQDAGDDLRQELDPHPRLVRGRRLPARRPRALPLVARHPARPRRADPRHRARALALPRRHHDPHLRSRRRRGAGALRLDPGDQRPHRPAAPLPGARRPAHRAREPGRLGREGRSPGSATATTWPTAGSTPPARLGFELRLACPDGLPSPTPRSSRATRASAKIMRHRATRARRRAAPTSSTPTCGPRWARRRSRRPRARPSRATSWTAR